MNTSTDPAVLVGLEPPDDAAVYRIAPEIALVQTVDFFTPIVDDPYAWGRIAAANSLSDVYAMGARPVTAMNLVGWPRALGFELLGRVLDGAGAACADAGVTIVGGHSVDDPEPKFGLAVTGLVHPDRIVRNRGARPGCQLVLTKPLGMGIISSGIKEGKTSSASEQRAIEVMSELNAPASEAMLEVGVAAATDVTGYGLIGHLGEMLGTDLAAELDFDAIPVLDEAFDLAAQGVFPGGSKRNVEASADRVDTGDLNEASRLVLFDAQTSGGLLMAVEPASTASLVAALERRGVTGWVIGRIVSGKGRMTVA
ncbi:MAG: selenide, water dikinase SelD [Actinomycetota bacterium]|nr:selenide, water dikinase SelD [Actinomycetota bacterium]